MSSNDLVSSDQVAFGKRLGLELDGKSVSEAYALILDTIDMGFFNIAELGSATPKQIAFAAKYQRIGAASRRVADAVITDLMKRLNDEAIERERLAPGVAVRNVHDAMQQKRVISSIREDGTVFFKGGNGAKAWARSLVRRLIECPVVRGALGPERLSTRLFLPDSQIAQFDCGVCAGEEADEARTDRDDPRRIYFGQNPDIDQPGLQHGTAKRTGKPEHDPKHKDERRLQGFFHYRFPKLDPVAGETLVRHHAFLLTRKVGNPVVE